MGSSLINIDDIDPAGPAGAVRFVRREFGLEAFGISWFELPASAEGGEHDETGLVRTRHGPRGSSARMEGFVVFDFALRYGHGRGDVGWLGEGWLYSREHVVDGIEAFPESLLMLYNGQNMGKLVLRVVT